MRIKPLGVVVLDASGHVKSMQRADEAACIAGVEAAGLIAG